MRSTSRLTSPLSRARGLGAAHHGVMHWWVQRVTAIALIPLTVWFLGSLLSVAQAEDSFQVASWLSSPCVAVAFAALIVALFWHAKLGVQVVIEDYVHCPCAKYSLLLANNFFCWGAALVSLLAILRLHLFDLVAGA